MCRDAQSTSTGFHKEATSDLSNVQTGDLSAQERSAEPPTRRDDSDSTPRDSPISGLFSRLPAELLINILKLVNPSRGQCASLLRATRHPVWQAFMRDKLYDSIDVKLVAARNEVTASPLDAQLVLATPQLRAALHNPHATRAIRRLRLCVSGANSTGHEVAIRAEEETASHAPVLTSLFSVLRQLLHREATVTITLSDTWKPACPPWDLGAEEWLPAMLTVLRHAVQVAQVQPLGLTLCLGGEWRFSRVWRG